MQASPRQSVVVNKEAVPMFSFVLGVFGLVVLYKVLTRDAHRPRWRRRGRWLTNYLAEMLDASSTQERIIGEAVSDLREKAASVKASTHGFRAKLAAAFRSEMFDDGAVSSGFDATQSAIEELKKAVRTHAKRLHETLSPSQRATFADLLERGPQGCGRRRRNRSERHQGRREGGPSSSGVFDL